MSGLLRFKDVDALDFIATRDAVYDLHPGRDLAEYRVTAIEMWLRRMGDKKLTDVGIFARQSHADGAGFILAKIDFVADLIIGAAVLIAARVAALNNEIRDYTNPR